MALSTRSRARKSSGTRTDAYHGPVVSVPACRFIEHAPAGRGEPPPSVKSLAADKQNAGDNDSDETKRPRAKELPAALE